MKGSADYVICITSSVASGDERECVSSIRDVESKISEGRNGERIAVVLKG